MAVRLTLTLDDNLYDRVQLLAQAQQQGIAETIANLLDETVPQVESSEGEMDDLDTDETVEREIRAYHQLHPELWRRYPEQHVAIHNGQMVDHDIDGIALSRRIYQRYPDTFVLIRQVNSTPERVIRLRSPRLANNEQ